MNAGQTNLKVGAKVQLQNIKGEYRHLNGRTGSITHPFAFGETKKGWLGIWLDGTDDNFNVKVNECKILSHE